jgi:hypothetical protein
MMNRLLRLGADLGGSYRLGFFCIRQKSRSNVDGDHRKNPKKVR